MANTTWSATDKTANAAISGGGLVATFSAANTGVRASDRQIRCRTSMSRFVCFR